MPSTNPASQPTGPQPRFTSPEERRAGLVQLMVRRGSNAATAREVVADLSDQQVDHVTLRLAGVKS